MMELERKNAPGEKIEKKQKKHHKKEKSDEKKDVKIRKTKKPAAFSLLADDKKINPALSSLFAVKSTKQVLPRTLSFRYVSEEDDDEELDGVDNAEEEDVVAEKHAIAKDTSAAPEANGASKRKRKRKVDGEEIEDVYMRRLEREEAKDAEQLAAERAAKRQRADDSVEEDEAQEATSEAENDEDVDAMDIDEEDADADLAPPPRHETETAADDEVSKANRTVFLGNVSTSAITSKTSRKTLQDHLRSFFVTIAPPAAGDPKHAVESLRFRSTPYATAIPKKASFAKKDVMDATSKSTNAYAVYSTQSLAEKAAKRLNGTVVLGRHLRVDAVAKTQPVDHRRCVFVGNLGFVDDESNIQAANEEEGKEKRKPSKQTSDVEEGLWQTFGKCGVVESVRVIRDSTTRVGKGIAYVQFEDVNAVEAALLYDEKKFPPLLPRKLRVSRAKAQKRNPKAGSSRPGSTSVPTGYQRKVLGVDATKVDKAGRMFGKAGAAKVRQTPHRSRDDTHNKKPIRRDHEGGEGIKKPEDFIFEGHRAKVGSGKVGLKLGGRTKKGKPTGRSAKRGAAFKAAKRKEKS